MTINLLYSVNCLKLSSPISDVITIIIIAMTMFMVLSS